MKRISSDSPATPSRASVFLHGQTGMGKSTFAVTGGRPLVILTEPKAMAILSRLNPNATGVVPESTDDLLAIFESLGDPATTKKYDRIVLDSYSDLTTSVAQWMKGASMLQTLEIQEYGILGNWCAGLVRAIQLSGLPSVIIARSTVKKTGRIEKIVPDGLGRSIEGLPGKCLPTCEARYDSERGYVIDSSADEFSQRCGLPWVPPIWDGNCLDYLLVVENAKTDTERSGRPPVPTNKEVRKEIAAKQEEAVNNKPAIPEEAAMFVDEVCGPEPEPAPKAERAVAEDSRELLDLCEKYLIPSAQMAAYLVARGYMTDPMAWRTVTAEGCAKAVSALKDPRARHSLLKYLTANHPVQ